MNFPFTVWSSPVPKNPSYRAAAKKPQVNQPQTHPVHILTEALKLLITENEALLKSFSTGLSL